MVVLAPECKMRRYQVEIAPLQPPLVTETRRYLCLFDVHNFVSPERSLTALKIEVKLLFLIGLDHVRLKLRSAGPSFLAKIMCPATPLQDCIAISFVH